MALARGASMATLALALLALGGCGDTLQDRPIAHNTLESLVVAPFPVYWLGRSFAGLQLTEASRDPSGAISVQYGDCRQGGQGTCVPPLRVVTSPDNSFTPASTAAHSELTVRGIAALSAQQGRALVLATGTVVVDVFATQSKLATAAAQALAPINRAGYPGQALAPALPESAYARTPLPAQVPAPLARMR